MVMNMENSKKIGCLFTQNRQNPMDLPPANNGKIPAFLQQAAIFLAGGTGYVGLELCWRGRSHGSMFLAGGLCLVLIGKMEEKHPRLSQPLRILAGAGIITAVELATGLVWNRGYTVWDYRQMPANLWGQICPAYCLLWLPVSAAAGFTYRWLRRNLPEGPGIGLPERRAPADQG